MLHQPSDQTQPQPTVDDIDPDELRGVSEAAALIGTDVQKGLAEVRRLRGLAYAAGATERRVQDEHYEASGRASDGVRVSEENWPGFADAEKASEEACHYYHYALMHVWRMPIRTAEDVATKAEFALEERNYAPDEDMVGYILKQIIEFHAEDESEKAFRNDYAAVEYEPLFTDPVDVERQREIWDGVFTGAQFALQFCRFDHVKGAEVVGNMLASDNAELFKNLVEVNRGHQSYLKTAIEILSVAEQRMMASGCRAISERPLLQAAK